MPELVDELEVLDDPLFSVAVVFEVTSGVPVAPVVDGEFADEVLDVLPGDDPDALFDDEFPAPAPSEAWAIPEPLTSAAPSPRVIAPAPNQVYGSMW